MQLSSETLARILWYPPISFWWKVERHNLFFFWCSARCLCPRVAPSARESPNHRGESVTIFRQRVSPHRGKVSLRETCHRTPTNRNNQNQCACAWNCWRNTGTNHYRAPERSTLINTSRSSGNLRLSEVKPLRPLCRATPP